FEAGLEKFRPKLQVMESIADVLAQDSLVEVTDVARHRQRRGRRGLEVGAVACRKSEVPALVRTKPEASADSGIIEAAPRHVPGFRPGGERGILHFGRVI